MSLIYMIYLLVLTIFELHLY